MNQRFVGRSGLSVSRIGLGTMTWGRDTGPEEAAAQLTAFVDVYGDGGAEVLLGRLIRERVKRSGLVLATKAVLTPGGPRSRDASRRHLIAALDLSLARLARFGHRS